MQTIHDDVTVKGELTADKLNVGDALVAVIEPLSNAIQDLTARLDSVVAQVAGMQEQIDELRAQNAELAEKINKTIIL